MRLTDILQEEQIILPLKTSDRDETIRILIEKLANSDIFSDKEQAFQAVLDREKIMTTGVGNGIAIPHCKHNSCPEFGVALGIHASGVDFNAIDKKKVNIIFLLVGPESNPGLHIKLLSRISRLMSNEELRDQLLDSKNAAEVHELLKEEENYYFDLD
ncbi:MAG: PTS sugar transporter subunit IIA [Calditrichaceae bacterium]|nr:PTS sugar transporter subunit IIA [Calditrichaceae bacterium]MBN2709234.1 PTS sugar transporter subunit IIA [Calditrichaceae bacterium]RQV96187.1 MAG: PTS sugar transporter subunit IIA [Calditrichota bacterium]